jgi:hypothetical protein
MRHILRAFEQIAGRIVAAVQEKIGAGDAIGEAARQCRALSLRAAIAMRGGGEIGGAERGLVAVLAEQLLDAGAIGSGRRAEDAREPRAIVVGETRRCGERILVVVLGPPCGRNRSRNRPEMRQVTSTRGRPMAAGGRTSMPVTRALPLSQTGRQPISARP